MVYIIKYTLKSLIDCNQDCNVHLQILMKPRDQIIKKKNNQYHLLQTDTLTLINNDPTLKIIGKQNI